ncbi:MAG TPA: proton-conducting transporter membrane subunit [Puia sp.]|nr:proton-conducting transporter membrane subunit [Puia sp.]
MPVAVIIATFFIASLFILLVGGRWKGFVAVAAVLVNGLVSANIAIRALTGQAFEEHFYTGLYFGELAIRVDALSAWFILLTDFTLLTGILYGMRYLKPYEGKAAELNVHYPCYILIHVAMLGIFTIQHLLWFLTAWEIMTLTAFLMIIFDHGKMEVVRAGINFLIQAHISFTFLTVAFIWIHLQSGAYDLAGVSTYLSRAHPALGFLLFLLFFAGFGIKAGFVPFHTWLPYAHPAAPAHVSGVLSGVLIKLGIFGILRIILLARGGFVLIGYTILIFSIVSGVYGVVMAIVQHNLKKLLAYHSIENIGIIGMGMGVGCIGIGLKNYLLIFAGFGAALLHTLNHALFKSLLFYAAGTVHQATHTMDIERLGGLVKKMPHTTVLFLAGSVAICGLPPLNGFVSEFLLYSGLFHGMAANLETSTLLLLAALSALALIGGLAMLCFTKAFGIIFLGRPRHLLPEPFKEDRLGLPPGYLTLALMVAIGLLPSLFLRLAAPAIALFTSVPGQLPAVDLASHIPLLSTMQAISVSTVVFLLMILAILLIKRKLASPVAAWSPTWGCGYAAPTARLQYTANSFVRPLRKLIRPLLMMNKSEGVIGGVFPSDPIRSDTHPYDKLEATLIDRPLRGLRRFLGRFDFLQNGSAPAYILYGMGFIVLVLLIPFLADAVTYLFNLFKQV